MKEYMEIRGGVRQYPMRGRLPDLPPGYERDPSSDYIIRPILEPCEHRQQYQPDNVCCAGVRTRCNRDTKDVAYFDCRICLQRKGRP